MASDKVLMRIDRTLDRIDARLEQGERRWADESERWEARDRRWEARDRRWEERDRRWEEWAEEQRRHNDALLERHARITADQIAAIEEFGRRHEAGFVALQSEIADQREQIQAQTEAMMKVLDRLPPTGPQG